ncbi:MAG: hypothetical protein Kow00109_28250 [Acidobacteriota bacterium]
MIKIVRVDERELHVSAALRNAAEVLRELPLVRYDPEREGRLNEVVFGEILEPICAHPAAGELSMLETIQPKDPSFSGDLEVHYCAPARPGFCLGILGNRYATPYVLGGLEHPVSGKPNGVVRGGTVVDSLFGVNCLGFVNAGIPPEERVQVRIHGVLVDGEGRPVNLRRYRRRPAEAARRCGRRTRQVVVGGYATDAGKTTCARALFQGLQTLGLTVTLEKKTGTACCKDWLSCLYDRDLDPREPGASQAFTVPLPREPRQAFDFVDTLGIASDVSLPTATFVEEASAFTAAYLAGRPADVHIVELADGFAHTRNQALLADSLFQGLTDLLIYNPLPYPDAVGHFFTFLERIGWPAHKPVLLSGPLANEPRHAMVLDEVVHRYQAKVVPCARREGDRWRPWPDPIAHAVARILELTAAEPTVSGPFPE